MVLYNAAKTRGAEDVLADLKPQSHMHARTAWATPLLLKHELQQRHLRLPFPS